MTELVAKPLISLLFPDLSGVNQPLAGETALRSQVLEEIELAGGYGVEMGLLIDVWQRWGTDCIAQVDLGERRHRNRPLAELGAQAHEVIGIALAEDPVIKLQRLGCDVAQQLITLTCGTVPHRLRGRGFRGVTANSTDRRPRH